KSEVVDGVEEGHPLAGGGEFTCQFVARRQVVRRLSVIVARQRRYLVKARLGEVVKVVQIAENARPIRVVPNELDLHGSGLGHPVVDVNTGVAPTVAARIVDWRHDVKRSDAEGPHPVRSRLE